MKKTIIALALAALPVAAMADVTLFGTIKGGLDFTKVKNVSDTKTELADWGSNIGFKGSEDLGNGLKAIWQVKQSINFASGSSNPELILDAQGKPVLDDNGQPTYKNTSNVFGTSESYLGLASPAGTLKVGYIGDNIKTEMGDVDPWVGNIGLGLTQGIRKTAVRYDTPDIYGFNGNLYVAPADNNGNNPVYAIGLNYENSGFYAKYGFELFHMAGDVTDGQVHALEAGYNANNLFVGVGVQVNKDHPFKDGVASSQPSKYIQAAATASYTLGNVTPRVSYAHGFKKDGMGGYDKVILGADYALSNRTTAAVAVGWNRLSSDVQGYQAEVGVEHKF